MGTSRWALAIAATTALIYGCTGASRPDQVVSPTATSPTAVATAAPPLATPTGAGGQEATLLARAVERLAQAKSYRFTIQAVHHWRTPEGQEYDWPFEGEGAWMLPNRFYSVMTGPADALFEVKMLDGIVTNRDARGLRPQASTAFGGPGEGAAPYTVLSYLKNSAAQGPVQTASLNGTDVLSFSFSPDFSKIAGMDASHASLQGKVRALQGTVWVEAGSGRPSQETVTVRSVDSQGLAQTVTITLKFSGYNLPVEIN